MWKDIKIAGMHIRKMLEEPRVWMVFFLVFVQMYFKSAELREAAEKYGYGLNLVAFLPLIFGGKLGFSRILAMFGVVFLFCNAPFMDDNQKFVFMRTKKKGWNRGTLFYIWLFSFFYIMLVWGSAIVPALPYIGLSDQWGTVIEKISITGELSGLIVDDSMLVKYSVTGAGMLEFTLLWLSSVFLGVLIYLAGLLFSGKAGIVTGSLFILLDGISLCLPENLRVMLFYLSPISLQQIWCLDTNNSNYYPSPVYAVGYLAAVCLVISAVCSAVFPKVGLDSREASMV